MRIESDGTLCGTYFFDDQGRELKALRNACRSITFHHQAGDVPRVTIEVLAKVQLTVADEDVKKIHPLDDMVHRANRR